MPSTKLPPTVRSVARPTTTIPEPTDRPFKPPRVTKAKQQEIDRTLMLRQSVNLKPAFFTLDPDALDPHMSSDPNVEKVFWHGRSADLSDPTVHCQVVGKGKSLREGKLQLAFLSEAQRNKYNAMHPDKPQVDRAGPVLRVCAAQGKPLLMPVEGFDDAYDKANRVLDCTIGRRGADGRRKKTKGSESAEACAFKVAGRPLAVAGIRKAKKSRSRR